VSSPAISAGTTNGAVPTATLLENLPDAIVLVDEGGAVRYANAAAELLFGQPIEELADQRFASLLAEPFAGEYEGFLRSHGAAEQIPILGERREVVCRQPSGTLVARHTRTEAGRGEPARDGRSGLPDGAD
jgi:PAS domain S-box-containing protein